MRIRCATKILKKVEKLRDSENEETRLQWAEDHLKDMEFTENCSDGGCFFQNYDFAFSYYMEHRRPLLKKEKSKLKYIEATKAMIVEWGKMSAEKKEPYEKKVD